MTRGAKILKDISFYSSSILVTQAITVIAAVMTRRFLGPTQMGAWAFLQTLLSYSEYSALGVMSALAYEVPRHNGRGEPEEARRTADTAFTFAVTSGILVSAVAIGYAILRRDSMPTELFWGFMMGSAFIILQRFNGLVITLARANKQFVIAGKQMFYSALVNAGLIALLSYRFRIYGFLSAMALSLLFNIVYLTWKTRYRPRWVPDWKRIVDLVRFGFPLMTVGFLNTVFETMDRLFITKFLGFEALGLYSISLMAVNYLNGVPNSIGIVTIPHLQETYSSTGDHTALKQYLDKVDAGYGIMMAVLIGLTWFIVPTLIHLVLPEYVSGLPALKLLVLGTYFAAVGQGYSQLIYVIRKHQVLLILIPIACAVSAAAYWLAVHTGRGVSGIAAAASIGMFTNFTLLFFYGAAQVETMRESCVRYAGVVGGFALMIILLLLADRVGSFAGPIGGPIVKTVVYLLTLAPVLWKLSAQHGLSRFWRFKGKKAGSPSDTD